MNKKTESIIVSINYDEDTGTGVLIVGGKRPGRHAEVLNAFSGEEAVELYKKLVTPKENNK